MVDTRQSDTTRLAKFILVLVDGKCRPGGDISQAPLPTDGISDANDHLCFYRFEIGGHLAASGNGLDRVINEIGKNALKFYRTSPPPL